MKKNFKKLSFFLLTISLSCSTIPISNQNKEFKENPSNRFLWGVSTAGYQIEDHKRPGIWSEDQNNISDTKGVSFNEHYYKWIDKAFGNGGGIQSNSIRLSIEWSEIQPRKPIEGVDDGFDEAKLNDYLNRIIHIREANKKIPLVTLVHFNYPKWLENETKENGFSDPKFKKAFLDYVEKVTRKLRPYVTYWITFNEPNMWLLTSSILNYFPPKHKECKEEKNINISLSKIDSKCSNDPEKDKNTFIKMHEEAYDIIHNIYKETKDKINNYSTPNPMVSMNYYYFPKANNILINILANLLPFFKYKDLLEKDSNDFPGIPFTLMPDINKLDYISFDYYFRLKEIPTSETAQEFWNSKIYEIYPEGLYDILKYYSKPKFKNKPIIIAENGFATKNGKNEQIMFDNNKTNFVTASRERYIFEHIRQLIKAKNEGVNVQGYYYWSLMDNYEWGTFEPRFGLFSIPNIGKKHLNNILEDVCATKSAYYYKYIIQNLVFNENNNIKTEDSNFNFQNISKFVEEEILKTPEQQKAFIKEMPYCGY